MSERTIQGEPEFHWEDWAIAEKTLDTIRQTCKSGTILEFGSGVGTRRLAATFEVISFEHDSDWLIYKDPPHKRIWQVHAPIINGWYDYKQINWSLRHYELCQIGAFAVDFEDSPNTYYVPRSAIAGVLIDGPPHLIGRLGILNHLDDLKPFLNCPIFVDDTNREADMILAARLGESLGRSVKSYDCNDEKRPGLKFSIVEWPGR